MKNTAKKITRITLIFICLLLSSCGDGAKNDINYQALGASDVVGVGATPLTNGYVYIIEEDIENQTGGKVDLDNLGLPGAEIGDIDNLEVQLLKLDDPDLITISTGANDLIDGDPVDGFESDLNGLLGKLRSVSPDALIVISNLPDLTKVKRFVDEPDSDVNTANIQAYNAAIARQAQAHGAQLVDLYSVPLNDSLFSQADGFHPSDAGHQVIADQFLEVIIPRLDQLTNG